MREVVLFAPILKQNRKPKTPATHA